MTSLSRIFNRYFFFILLLVVLIVVFSANIGSRMFFENFTLQARYEQDATIMNGIKDILYGQYGFGIRVYFISLLARQHGVDIMIKREEEVIFTTAKQYLSAEDEVAYTRYDFEDMDIYIGRNKNILLEEANRGYLRTLNILYILTFAFSMMVAILLASLLSKRLSRPIMQISRNINHISQGRYGEIIKPQTKARELVFLSEELDRMAEHKKNEERMRQRLSNDIVHELKTPITALVANLEAINDGIYQADTERIQVLLEQTNRLAKMVNHLSDLALIETEKDNIEMSGQNLAELLRHICMVYGPAAEENGIILKQDIREELHISGNRDRLMQIYVNLMSNALKYTDRGGTVTVRLFGADGRVVTEVEDTGVGIDPRDLPFIFERFYRADQSRSTRTGGAGIGLAIVKAIVAAHDGDISIESQPGTGTKVQVSFWGKISESP
ncbi:MAG: HAMP domain-containing sensor histidine kinase [Clostridia bacterium]